MNKDLVALFEYLEREKGIKREIIIGSIEEALELAARKSVEGITNANVRVDPNTGEIDVTCEKEIVEKVKYPGEEISLEAARELDPDCNSGQFIEVVVTPAQFGRIAAQTAKQVIAQKLRGAERDVIYSEYRDRVGEIINGTVKRVVKGRTVIVDLGKVEAILPERFIPRTEHYNVGDRILALLYEVRDTEGGGAEAVLSRTAPDLVVELFKQEVPEIQEGLIEVVKVVREGGHRCKLAVRSNDPKVDPVGACVGVRGTRVKNVIRELGNEKIDILPYMEDRVEMLERSLSPIEIKKISEEEETIWIVVDDEDYPAALGKRGINARLSGELIGVRLEIEKMTDHKKAQVVQRKQLSLSEDAWLDEPVQIAGMNQFIIDSLSAAGFDTPRKILGATPEQLIESADISKEMAEDILEKVTKP
ncbi:MAG: transcription termination factor NusA [Candidatus Algichlamydia australiensis]|nr:transcription termination factor NusA [Chlamydiales bacterium]